MYVGILFVVCPLPEGRPPLGGGLLLQGDSLLCAAYNRDIAHGKWNGMMIQKHIGYTSWNDDFARDRMPSVVRISNTTPGGYTFTSDAGRVVMEAEHYWKAEIPENLKTQSAGLKWEVIPDMGRTRSAVTLMPYDQPVDGASLCYRFDMTGQEPDSVTIHIVLKSTLDYLNQGGLTYTVRLDHGTAKTINFNALLNEQPENIYSIYYPTVARRVIESRITLPLSKTPDAIHTLTLMPHAPAIVFEKIAIDWGSFRPSYLFMDESPLSRTE